MVETNIKNNCIFYLGNQRLEIEAWEIEEVANLENQDAPYLRITMPKEHYSYELETHLRDQHFIQVEVTITENKQFKEAFWGFYQIKELFELKSKSQVILTPSFVKRRWIEQFAKTLNRTYEQVIDSICYILQVTPLQLEVVLDQQDIPIEAILDMETVVALAFFRAKASYQNVLDFPASQITATLAGQPLHVEVNVNVTLTKDPSKEIPFFKILIPPEKTTLRNIYDYPVICNFIITEFFHMQNSVCKDQYSFINYMIAVTAKPQLDQAFCTLSGLPSIN